MWAKEQRGGTGCAQRKGGMCHSDQLTTELICRRRCLNASLVFQSKKAPHSGQIVEVNQAFSFFIAVSLPLQFRIHSTNMSFSPLLVLEQWNCLLILQTVFFPPQFSVLFPVSVLLCIFPGILIGKLKRSYQLSLVCFFVCFMTSYYLNFHIYRKVERILQQMPIYMPTTQSLPKVLLLLINSNF